MLGGVEMKRIDKKKREAALEYRWFVTTYDPEDEGYRERADVLANEWRMWWKLNDAIRNPRGQR